MKTPEDAKEPIVGGQTGYAIPLIVSVTGHRDLVAAEAPAIRQRVREFFAGLLAEYPERGVSVMSSLAEGADTLVAEVALELGVRLIAPLPMPLEYYRQDFAEGAPRERFRALLARARDVFELPLTPGNTGQTIAEDAGRRARQYAQLGVFLSAHCHILLALWDGRDSGRLGGTGQVVRFHHDDVMPGYTPRATGGRLALTDDESDLVYHIVVSRDRDGGNPADGLEPLSASWYTSDEQNPRTGEMPERHRRVLEHTAEFSRDAKKYSQSIRREGWTLAPGSETASVPAAARDIDHVYRAADWLAIHFQKRHLRSLLGTHALAMCMGVAYIVYSDLLPARLLIVAFIGFFLVAAVNHHFARRGAWHRKYLDYRTLAEGLRVQFYWACAGVTSDNVSKFSHDNFLQMQDADLGWIRNVMRVAGMECNVAPYRADEGLEFSIAEWIGDEEHGQLGYYRRKASEKIARNRRTQQLAAIVMIVSMIALAAFLLTSGPLADRIRNPVTVLMGMLLLAVGVRQSYSFSIADFELVKLYEFMYRIFERARRRIVRSRSNDERRQVLRLLGETALEEHAEWILMHRERNVDEGELWRMSG